MVGSPESFSVAQKELMVSEELKRAIEEVYRDMGGVGLRESIKAEEPLPKRPARTEPEIPTKPKEKPADPKPGREEESPYRRKKRQ